MSEERKPHVWPWIAALLIGLPVLYVASFGPACWQFARERPTRFDQIFPGPLPKYAPRAYWPIGWLAKNGPRPIGNAIFWYAKREPREAILLPEPEYCLEALPYYAPNRIYLPRERRFGATVSLTTQASQRLSLGELVSLARSVKSTYGQPVLVVLGHWEVEKDKPGEKRTAFNMVFSWNASELAAFEEATTRVAEFRVADGDETYRVYMMR